eukprot:Sspe_Gene.8383::Locus_2861_Transcript_1_1_Confidence_1.000_Length_14125::g.8383::m.8383/K17570/HYDIN; hydrocephalus-inducing protein
MTDAAARRANAAVAVGTKGATTGSAVSAPRADGLLSQKQIAFVVSPPEIVFRNYEPFKCYETPLSFKNQTKTTKAVRIVAPESRYFKVSEPRSTSNTLKVAAGLSVTYTIGFRPEEDCDYECDLVVITEHERFLVPVRAVASRGRLDLPSGYTFNQAPVKADTERTLYLRNVGTKPTQWTMEVSPPWTITPTAGSLEPGAGMQALLHFHPLYCMRYSGEMVVSYSNGDTSTLALRGEACNIPVTLSHRELTLAPTFISLERQEVVTLVNNSDITVAFQWKSHETPEEEEMEKQRVVELLAHKEAAAREALLNTTPRSASAGKIGTMGDLDVAAFQARELKTLTRKARGRRQMLTQGNLVFEHDFFTIEPLSGMVPAKAKREIVVTFNPQTAADCKAIAYLDVVGVDQRLPLMLRGQGIGPKCQFSYDALDLGDVFINSIHHYEVMLENRGSIDARFSLNPSKALFASKFKFVPSHGTVAPGESEVIRIVFCSDIIGILNEAFHFHIQGANDDLVLHFKGRVIGPTFHFDTEEIDFGNVSYNFMHRRTFSLVNTSEIPMRFHLRVPEDSQGRAREFEIVPANGLVLPHGKQKITLDFLSNTVQEYNAHLVVDIDEVGENLYSVPIKATCIVPDVTVTKDAIDFGQGGLCFVGHPYTMELDVKNDTSLSAKYEIGLPPEDDPIRRKVSIELDARKGIVPARSVHQVAVTLTAKMVGTVHLPIYVRILGSEKRIPVSLSAKITGPVVNIDQTTLDFGKVTVLSEHSRKVELTNTSPIPAMYSTRLVNRSPIFSLKNGEGLIPPRSSCFLPVYAFLDDTVRFTEELIVTISNSKDLQIKLQASGSGTTLVPSIPLDREVDFHNVFTTALVQKTFVLFNKGRRPLQVTWTNDRPKPKEGEPPFTFTIQPERATIAGKGEQEFVIEGSNSKPGKASERFVCKLAKTHKLVFRPTVVGTFVVPLLEPSDRVLHFTYLWESGKETDDLRQTRPLTLRNISPLVLEFSLKAGHPFTIDKTDYVLREHESCTVHVEFDAGYRNDRMSHKLKTKLTIVYKDHPQREHIDLSADVAFPNISLEPVDASPGVNLSPAKPDLPSVDFGCIMHETEKRVFVAIVNNSKVTAQYSWVFEQGIDQDAVTSPSSFDVLPIRGQLKPGEAERVELAYYAQAPRKACTTAVLAVEGGPEYKINLVGEASTMQFKFDKSLLDFGPQPYDKTDERELMLQNLGKVTFSYQVDLSRVSRPGCVDVLPQQGIVRAGEKAKMAVRFCPRIPDKVSVTFQVQVAHFEPHNITVKGLGLYPSVSLGGQGVSRILPPNPEKYMALAKELLEQDPRRYFLRGLPSQPKPPAAVEEQKVLADLDSEVERLFFTDLITAPPSDASTTSPPPARSPETASDEKLAGVETNPYALPVRKSPSGENKPVVACYKVDFGTVVKGDVKKKTLKVTNVSSAPLSFAVDKKMLQNSGIVITPDKVNKLNGHPQYASQQLEIQLITKGDKAKDVSFGEFHLSIPLDIRGGGLILLEVSAYIMVPQLVVVNMPDGALTFDTVTELPDGSQQTIGVTVGETRIQTLQFHNPLPLPCEWTIKVETKRNQPKNRFVCKPDKGLLASGDSCNVQVMFIPTEGGTTSGVVSIKVAHNPRALSVPVKGTGEDLLIELSQTELQLGPVLPFTPTEVEFTVTNKSKVPVECLATNFDKMHLVEAEILRALDHLYDSDGVLLLPPRPVGGALPDELLEAYYAKLENMDQALGSAIEEAGNVGEIPPPDHVPSLQSGTPVPVASEVPTNPTSDTVTTACPVVVVHGPPLSGKSTVATMLGSCYGFPVITLDEVFLAAVEHDTEAGLHIKNIIDPLPGKEPAVANEAMLASVLSARLAHMNGVIIDGLVSRTTRLTDALARAVCGATQRGGVHMVLLDTDSQCIELRRAIQAEKAALDDLQRAHVPEVSEEEYDAMDAAARKAHETALRRMRKAKQSAKAATEHRVKLERERQEGELPMTLLEATKHEEAQRLAAEAEEQASKKKAGGKKPPPPPEPEQPVIDASTPPVEVFTKLYGAVQRALEGAGAKVVPYTTQSPPWKESKEADMEATKQALTSPGDGGLPFPVVSDKPAENEAKLSIPAPITQMRLERPKAAPDAVVPKYFKILTQQPKAPPPPEPTKQPPKGKQPAKEPPTPDPTAKVPEEMEWVDTVSRWILQQGEQRTLRIRFQASTACEGGFVEVINFGIVGSSNITPLKCHGIAAQPDVVRDMKVAFTRKKGVKRHAFDFGPLIIKAPQQQESKPQLSKRSVAGTAGTDLAGVMVPEQNVEVIKIDNHPLFDAEITWVFADADQKVFMVNPTTMSVKAGGSDKLKIIACPTVAGVVEQTLVGLIKDNPSPILFPLTCVGCQPEVELTGSGEPMEGGGRTIDFGRLLLDESLQHSFAIWNRTPIPIRWELVESSDPTKKLRPEFQVEQVQYIKDSRGKEKEVRERERPDGAKSPVIARGRLDAKGGVRDHTNMMITFCASRADIVRCEFVLQVKDDTDAGVTQSIPVVLLAEAYDVYLEATKQLLMGVNGLAKVGMEYKDTIKLCNRGKYPFLYMVHMKKKLHNYFRVDPVQGILKPQKDTPQLVEVTFEAKSEVSFRGDHRAEFEVRVYHIPPEGADDYKDDDTPKRLIGSSPVLVEVEAKRVRYQIIPTHGLNFGPCLFNDKKKMPFDILNNGQFELRFKLYDHSQGPPDANATPEPVEVKGKSAAKKAPGKAVAAAGPHELEIGAFKVTPCEGTVAPGEKREISVQLDPRGAASSSFTERLGVFVEDCDPGEPCESFLLEAESCVPGILADLDSPESDLIFEEQQIVNRLDAFRKQHSVFAREDKVFSFGSIITRQRVQEQFRISNPNKVLCTVTVGIKKRGDAENAAFEAHWAVPGNPSTLDIPPHEHRYVLVSFRPSELRSYFAMFEAVVKDGTNPRTKELAFELRGEGSLPQISIQLPPPPPPRIVADPSPVVETGKGKKGAHRPSSAIKKGAGAPPEPQLGRHVLQFPRTIVGKRVARTLGVSNVGDLPAEIKFKLPARGSPCFAFPDRNEVYVLQPGEVSQYAVYFEPIKAENFETKLSLLVNDNPFEDTTVTLQGEGVVETVTFEGLGDSENLVALPDCGLKETSSSRFTVQNHSDHSLRFTWQPPSLPDGSPDTRFAITPSVGHIPPKGSKPITISFTSPTPEDFEKAHFVFQYWPIAMLRDPSKRSVVLDWDNRQTVVRWEQDITPPPTPPAKEVEVEEPVKPVGKGKKGEKVQQQQAQPPPPPPEPEVPEAPALSPEEAAAQQRAKELERRRRPLRRVVDVAPEPEYEYIGATEASPTPPASTKDLFASVVCDHSRWELGLAPDGQPLEKGVRFATTKLFQTRTIHFDLRNVGRIAFDCQWEVVDTFKKPLDEHLVGTFKIDPATCRVPPGGTATCAVSYSPLDTEPHKALLCATIPHSDPAEDELPEIPLSGKAECPLVHFDLPESDYLTADRRNPELPGPGGKYGAVDKSTRVVEFHCSGIRVRNTRRFSIYNPTNMSYEYEWVDITENQQASKLFVCHTPRGVVHSGKKSEVVFDFTPDNLNLHETFWELRIGGASVSELFKQSVIPFVMVGKAAEPEVYFSQTRINFEQVLLGGKAKQVINLHNREGMPFNFSFEKLERGVIAVSPAVGSVPPLSALPIEVTFTPTSEEPYNFTLLCNVKKMTNALTCNVKGEGYTIHESVVLRNPDGSTALLSSTSPSTVDFGRVHINEQQTKQVIISNTGKLPFDYKWARAPSPFVTVSPELDTVGPREKSVCSITFHPTKVVSLENYKLACKVTNAGTYVVNLTGVGMQPNVHFSTTRVEFGPHFVQYPGLQDDGKQVTLLITNRDTVECSYDCNFTCPPWLHVNATPSVLAKAGSKEKDGTYTDRREVIFTFTPHEAGVYETVVPFEVNGRFTVNVHVVGEGTVPKVELAPGQQRTLNFGAVRAGEKKMLTCKVQCKSRIPTPFSLASTLADVKPPVLSVVPREPILLKPREVRAIEFTFAPRDLRLVPFEYHLECEVAGLKKPLVSVQGSSVGMEVHLDQKSLSFGTVVQGTRQTKKVVIMNTGDVGVQFQWPEKLLENTGFTITPSQGFLLPHLEQVCEFAFQPATPSSGAQREIELRIVDSSVSPPISRTLALSLSAVCGKKPPVAEEHVFKCSVRETCKKTIKITNPTPETWVFSPVLEPSVWRGAEKVEVPAMGSTEYEVVYAPLFMTKTNAKGEKECDHGTLFFPIPTGDSRQMMHALVGEAEPPPPAGTVEQEVQAKSTATILLTIRNWLPQPQRFTVTREFSPVDESVVITGASTIDVPSDSSRNYKFTLVSHREGKYSGNVKFVNETTKEFVHYNVNVVVKPPKELSVVRIRTPARQAHSETIFVENPLPRAVTLDVSASGVQSELSFPDKLTVEAKSAGRLKINYFPLLASEERTARLVLKCPELGEFPHTLLLTALPPVPERGMRFQAPLGQSQTLTAKIVSYAKTPVDYTLKFLDPKTPFARPGGQGGVIKAQASTRPEGEEVTFDIVFEPSRLGEARDTVEVVSSVGGHYSIALVGTCTAPQRQGPFECRPGQPRSIPFKNVFLETMSFSIISDSPCFTVGKAVEVVPPKKEVSFPVTFKPGPDDGSGPPRAKLTVSCQTSEGATVAWVFYLRGVETEGTAAAGSKK